MTSSGRTSTEIRKHPITPHRRLVDAPSARVSRLHFDEADRHALRRLPHAGRRRAIGAIDARNGTCRRLADIKRAMLYA